MKVVGICGSPKKQNSTTLFGLQKAMDAVAQCGLETEIVSLSRYDFTGCVDCGKCRKEYTCWLDDDFTNTILPLLKDDDIKGMILASPVYFGGVSSQMKTFIDRCVLFRRNGFRFENLIAGVLTVGRSRNGGQELTAMDLVKNAMIQGMTVVSDASPTSHFGGILWSGKTGGIEQDDVGIMTAENMGKRVGELVNKVFG
ncbi:MAG: flavodoxin family protein [Chitinispirillaceae bacterium]